MKNLKSINEFLNESELQEEILTIPKKFKILRGALGDTIPVKVIISEFNDANQGNGYELLDYKDGMFMGRDIIYDYNNQLDKVIGSRTRDGKIVDRVIKVPSMSYSEPQKLKPIDVFIMLNDLYREY